MGPSLAEHRALLAHDARHGEPAPRLGARFHWARSWLWQKTRQWERCDALVCGANPILGALASAALASQGHRVLWAWSDAEDAWDYPLTVGGQADDLFLAAGLPRMGQGWFDALAQASRGRVKLARGWDLAYACDQGQTKLGFLAPSPARKWGPAREQATRWAGRAFEQWATLQVKARPARHGGAAREPIVGHARRIHVSDALDGVARAQGREEGARADRLGRARWHAQTTWDFKDRSREDLSLALGWGNWT